MKRREFIKGVALTTAGIALSPIIFEACSTHKRMNILFIISGDPPWHQGAGGRAWIFNDEVIIT